MDASSGEALSFRVSLAERRARLATLQGDAASHLSHLSEALAAQGAVLEAVRGDFEDARAEARLRIASIARRIAATHVAARRFSDAHDVLKDVLARSAEDPAVMLDLARIDLRMGDAGACEERVLHAPFATTLGPS
jgi:hypothetical protein